ncbi:MAG: hypothetical protein JWP03_3116 [Phycisphaerales bacterium]|jgi:hypothetical protein|nr:hypothetical protein [Phycisphaerales bacterium]
MSDPTLPIAVAAPPQLLHYSTGSSDVHVGTVSPAGLLMTLLGGLGAAALAALVAFFWVVFRLPLSLIGSLGAQSLIVGGALFWLFKRFKLRGSAAGLVLGIVCGLASAFFFHYGLYVRNVYRSHAEWTAQIERAKAAGDLRINPAYADWIEKHPFAAFDQFVFPLTGHHGFLGYIQLRAPKLAGLGIIQAVLVASVATFMGKKAATRPVCRSCSEWLQPPIEVAVLSVALAEPLVTAIQSDDAAEILRIHHLPGPFLAGGRVIARLHFCKRCSLRYVDVIARAPTGSSPQLGLTVISKETLDALRFEYSEPATVQPVLSEQPTPVGNTSEGTPE